jgi:uncharacterized DUF497 family protein
MRRLRAASILVRYVTACGYEHTPALDSTLGRKTLRAKSPGHHTKALDNVYVCAYNVTMNYQWDPHKARVNQHKHGVDFADAVGVLEDDLALTIPEEAPEEERFVTLGRDALGRVLVVTYRANSIRIISARKATARERSRYEESDED